MIETPGHVRKKTQWVLWGKPT